MTTFDVSDSPVISIEDNFNLVYNGRYGRVVWDRETNTNHVETMKGPLPEGKFVWDGVDWLGGMDPGEKKLVPFDVVRVYFGDPRSIMTAGQRFEDRKGKVGDIAPRPEETRRLSVLYGVYDTDAHLVKDMVPDVSISTADGTVVVCPASDPMGRYIYGHISESAESHDLATTIEQMKMQIRLLEEQAKAEAKKGSNNGADVKDDQPPARGSSR
jgi:hypothetical protein